MQVYISDNYEEMSALAAGHLNLFMSQGSAPLLCVASGDSPAGMYRHLLRGVQQQDWKTTQWDYVALDEWIGMNGTDEGSCRYHLNQQLFNPLAVPAEKICFFDGRAADLEAECATAESFISGHHGIDVAVLGLGLNGHIGMNEPGTAPDSRAHIAELDPLTVQTAQKYFENPREITGGLTLGLGTILEAKRIFLLVSGVRKAGVVKALLEGPVTPALPASLLQNHPGARLYLDKDAASFLKTN